MRRLALVVLALAACKGRDEQKPVAKVSTDVGAADPWTSQKATAKDTLTKKGANQFWHKFELTMKGETHTIVEETCKKK